jgi:hypothetical protein
MYSKNNYDIYKNIMFNNNLKYKFIFDNDLLFEKNKKNNKNIFILNENTCYKKKLISKIERDIKNKKKELIIKYKNNNTSNNNNNNNNKLAICEDFNISFNEISNNNIMKYLLKKNG